MLVGGWFCILVADYYLGLETEFLNERYWRAVFSVRARAAAARASPLHLHCTAVVMRSFRQQLGAAVLQTKGQYPAIHHPLPPLQCLKIQLTTAASEDVWCWHNCSVCILTSAVAYLLFCWICGNWGNNLQRGGQTKNLRRPFRENNAE